ncbi:MAG: CHAT domain-containing tetratricopeptide repeat protein [Cytophagales bacterium]|nr:CHAT domain-containing tetratricopeptide repeat protein [Cytophagales bacterium]
MNRISSIIIFIFFATISYSQDIQNFKVQYDTCRVRFNHGKYSDAGNWLEENLPTAKFKQKDVTYWDMNNLLARCYVKMGKLKRAEQQFKETIQYYEEPKNASLRAHANHQSARINLAFLYYTTKEYEKAEENYRIGMELKRQQTGEKHPDYLTLLNNIAVLHNIEGRNVKADSLYTRLLELKKAVYTENSAEYIQTLYNKANLYKNTGRYIAAEPLFVRVVNFRKVNPGEKHPDYLNAYKHLGELYTYQRRYTEAEPIFTKLIDLNRLQYGEKNPNYTEALNNLGNLYIAMERYTDAEKIYLQVSDIRRNTLGKNHIDYASSLSNLGLLYRKMSKYTFSEKFYKRSLDIYESNVGKKHSSFVINLVNLASLYREMGRFLDAETRYKKAQDIYKETIGEKNVEYAGLLNNMALFYTEMGKYEIAEQYYKESLEITDAIEGQDHPDYATTLNNLASLYKTEGRYEEAEGIYLRSAKIRKTTLGEQNYDYATSLNNLGALYEVMGRHKDAETYYLQSLSIIKQIFGEKHPAYANQLNNLAGLYEITNQYDQAEKLYNEALEIQAEILGEKHPDYILTLNNLALLQQKSGNFDKAEELYKRNINKTKATLGPKHPNYATALSNLAGLYESVARYREAEKLYLEALQIRKEVLGEKHPSYGLSLTSLARLYTALRQFVKSDTMWYKAINLDLYEIKEYFPSMSEKEKGEFYATIKEYFEQFNSYAVVRHKTDPNIIGKMYNNQLATKALLLSASNKLRQNILSSGDTILIHNFKEWQNQKEFLSKVYAMSKEDIETQHINVDSLEHAVNNMEKALSRGSEFFAAASENKLYTWQDVKKKLKPGEVAMEIIRFQKFRFDSAGIYTDTVMYAALIVKHNTEKNPEMILNPEGYVMETKLLKYYRNAIKSQSEDDYCYKYFWKDISTALKGSKKIFISPDGAYNQLNINTLRNVQTKQYVLDEIDIQVVSNTKDLVTHAYKQSPEKSIVLCGNPNFLYKEKKRRAEGGYNEPEPKYEVTLPQLPGTEIEVKGISEIATQNGWQSKVYTGSQVTEEKVKNINNVTVLHIATHGFFENDVQLGKNKSKSAAKENPLMRSGLMLAGSDITLQNKKNGYITHKEGKTEDGILTAYEAMNLNLDKTDLVILSACETGLGEVKNGEGVYGLQRSFLVAGSKSIVISLWTVNDETTQKLMTLFYSNWLKTGERRKSFHDAQSQLRKSFPNPYYWGAFVMIGD